MKFEKVKEKKKGFHITITDLTSGETIIDADSKAIIGGVACGEKIRSMGFTACNATTLMNTLYAADKVVKELIKKEKKKILPEVISDLLFGDDDDDEEEEEDDDE